MEELWQKYRDLIACMEKYDIVGDQSKEARQIIEQTLKSIENKSKHEDDSPSKRSRSSKRKTRSKENVEKVCSPAKEVSKPLLNENSSTSSMEKFAIPPRRSKRTSIDDDKKKVKSIDRKRKVSESSVNSSTSSVNTKRSARRKLSSSTLESSMNKTFSATVTEKRNHKGETPLHVASIKGDVAKIQELLDLGVNPNTKDYTGYTPLMEAVNNGRWEAAKLLVENGAAPYVPGPDFDTVLHYAATRNAGDVIPLLIQYGGDVSAKNRYNLTPLDVAIASNKPILSKSYPKKSIKTTATPSIFEQIPNFPVNVFVWNLPEKYNKSLKILETNHRVTVEKAISANTKFAITENCVTDANSLLAITLGVPLVDARWLSECNEDSVADLAGYQIPNIGGYNDAALLSYANALKLFPGIFSGCFFHFKGFDKVHKFSHALNVTKQLLSACVTNGGGKVLKREPDPEYIPPEEIFRPFHARENSVLSKCSHYIIYSKPPELKYNMSHVKSLPVEWLIECIQNFSLVDP